MEKITFLAGKDTYDKLYKFMLEQDIEYQKLQFYKGKIYPFNYLQKKETDTHIYWQAVAKTPMFENNVLFYRHQAMEGATYDKKKQTIKIWFGKHYNRLRPDLQDDITSTLVPWFNKSLKNHICFNQMITNTILQRMVKGTIKSRVDIIKSYLKYNPYKQFELNAQKIAHVYSNGPGYTDIRSMKHAFLASKHPNDIVNYMFDNMHTFYMHVQDWENLAKLALSIGEEFDVNWDKEERNKRFVYYRRKQNKLDTIYSKTLGLKEPKLDDLPF